MGALLFLVHSTSGEKGTILKREYYWYVGLINRLRWDNPSRKYHRRITLNNDTSITPHSPA
jgi:hypothetical protein